jgi:hypothetical protein
MKVLHVSPTYYASDSVVGGGEKYILYLARALLAAGGGIKNAILAFGEKAAEIRIASTWKSSSARWWTLMS